VSTGKNVADKIRGRLQFGLIGYFVGLPPAMELGLEALPSTHVQTGRDRGERQGGLPTQARSQGQLGRVAFGSLVQVSLGPAQRLEFLTDDPLRLGLRVVEFGLPAVVLKRNCSSTRFAWRPLPTTGSATPGSISRENGMKLVNVANYGTLTA